MQRITYRHPVTRQEFQFEPGVSRQEARSRMDAYYARRQAEADAQETANAEAYKQYLRDNGSSLGSGFRRGLSQLPILGTQALAAGAGLFGANGARDALLESAAARQDTLNREQPALYDSFTQDPLGYVGERVGEQVPNIGLTLAGAGVGGIGARMALKAASDQAIRRSAVAGALTPAYGLQAGENYGSYVDEYGVDKASPGAALATALPQSALEVYGPLSFLKGMKGTSPLGMAQPDLVREAKRSTLGAAGIGAAKGAGRGFATEGVTEAGQEALKFAGGDFSQGQQFGSFAQDPNKLASIGESALVGGLTGGAFGGAFGAPGGVSSRNQAQQLRADRVGSYLEGRKARNEVEPVPETPAMLALPAPTGTPRTPQLGLDPGVDDRAFAARRAAEQEMASARATGPTVDPAPLDDAPPDMRSTDAENMTLPGMQPSLFDDGAPAPRADVAGVFEAAGIVSSAPPRNAYERQAQRVGQMLADKSSEGLDPMSVSASDQSVYNELVNLLATANKPASLATPAQKQALKGLIDSVNPAKLDDDARKTARAAQVAAKTKAPTAEELATVAAKVQATKDTPPTAAVSRGYKGAEVEGRPATQADDAELAAAQRVWDANRGQAPAWSELTDSPWFVEKTPTGEELTTLQNKGDAGRPDPAVAKAVAEDVKRVFARRLADGKFTPETAAEEIAAATAEVQAPTPTVPENLGPKASRGQKADAGPRGRQSPKLKAARERAAQALEDLVDVRAAIQQSKKDTDPANRQARLDLVKQEKTANEKYLAAVAEVAQQERDAPADTGMTGSEAASDQLKKQREAIKAKLAKEATAERAKATAATGDVKATAAKIADLNKKKPAAKNPKTKPAPVEETIDEIDSTPEPDADLYDTQDYNDDPTFNLRYREQQKLAEDQGTPIKDMAATAARLRRLAARHFKGVKINFVTDLGEARRLGDKDVTEAIDGGANGMMTADGRIYIFLPNISTEQEADLTLFHEPGHLFMRAVPQAVLKAMMAPFVRNAKIMADAEQWMRDPENRKRMAQYPRADWKTIALEEAIVENGQTAFGKTNVKQLAAKFINWLRRLGAVKLADMLAKLNNDVQTVEFLFEMRRKYDAQGGRGDGGGGPSRLRSKDSRAPEKTVSTSTADLMASQNLRDMIDKEIRGERKTLFKAAAERLLSPGKTGLILPSLDLRSLGKMLDEVGVRIDPDGTGPFANVGRNLSKWLHEQDATAQSIRASFERNALEPLTKLKPETFQKVQTLLYQASFARFDPRPKADNKRSPKDAKSKTEQDALVRDYNALPADGKAAFTAVADTTRNSFNEMRVRLIKHAERLLEASRDAARIAGPEETAAAQADVVRRKAGLEKLNTLMDQIGEVMPYVPFKRQGDYLISFLDPKSGQETVWAYETNTERDRAYEALKRRNVKKAEKFNRYEEPERFMGTLDSTTQAVLKALKEARGAQDSKIAKPSLGPAKPRAAKDIETDIFDEIESHLTDTLLMLNPASRTLDAIAGRKNVPGMDFDILRSISSYAASTARDQSNLRYGADISKSFADINRMMAASSADPALRMGVEGRVYMSDADLKTTQDIVGEINKRREFIMAPSYSPVANLLTKGGFYFFMGLNPSSALLQLFQMVMVQAPVLSGKYGTTKAFNAMFGAASRVFGSEAPLREFLDKGEGHELARYDPTMLNPDGSAKDGADDATRGYAKLRTSKSRSDQYRAVIVDMIRRGVLNDAIAQDLIAMKEGRDPTSRGAKVERALSFMMKFSEQLNRTASIVAAYDLATEKSGRKWADVMDEIEQHVYEGHGDYSAINSPRPWHYNTGKVLLLFKKFGFHMYTTLGMYMRDYLKNPNLTKEEKREAATKFGVMLLTTASMTGLAGMPVYGLLSSIYFMFQSALGDDEETRNLTVALRAGMDKVGVSGIPTDALLGGLPRLVGLNLTSRLGYADVFFRDPDENLDQKKMVEWIVQTLGGPLVGAVEQVTRGVQKVANGDLVAGTAEMLGATLRNAVRAGQMVADGELRSRRGDQIAETGAYDALLQSIGFAPGRVTEQQEIMFAAKAVDVRLNKTRARALEIYRNAYVLGDTDMMERAQDEIAQVNETAARLGLPKYRITPETMQRSVKARVKNDENFDRGVRFSPSTSRATEEIRQLAE